MILICPACAARFMIPDGALGASGRTVRCGACAHSWHQFPEPAVPPPAEPSPPATGHEPAPSSIRAPARPLAAPVSAPAAPVSAFATAPAAGSAELSGPPSAETDTVKEAEPKKSKWGWRRRDEAKPEGEAKLASDTKFGTEPKLETEVKLATEPKIGADAKVEPDSKPAPEVRPEPSPPALAVTGAADIAAREVAAADAEGERGRRGASRVLVWFLFVFVVAAIVLGGYRYRNDVVRIWPPAATIYGWLGLDIEALNGVGLRVVQDSLKFRREAEGGVPILVVGGEILNEAKRSQRLTPMRIDLLDKDARVLRTERVRIGDRVVDPGKTVPFQTSIPNYPPETTAVRITFDVSG